MAPLGLAMQVKVQQGPFLLLQLARVSLGPPSIMGPCWLQNDEGTRALLPGLPRAFSG